MRPPTDPYELVLSLRAIRAYRDEPIADEHLHAILEAGRWTGSAKNIQPWAFIVVRDPDRRQKLAEFGRFTTPIRLAPLVIVLVRLPGGGDFDIGRLAQNMMLGAWALGIGSCPVTLHDEDDARAFLGVPEDHGCRWSVAFGYPDEEESRRQRERLGGLIPAGRKPLTELVHHERW